MIGWAPRFTTRLLLVLITFFTFLTGYALFSGKIKTCGCFGDCIPLLPIHSFIKDVVLLLMVILLARKHDLIRPIMPLRACLFLTLFSAGLVFWGQLQVLRHLPFVDCLPYHPGSNLLQKMQPPPGSIPDSVATFYTYKVDGKEISFDAMHFPDDFDESRYAFVSRTDKVVRKGNATPVIHDLALYNTKGEDTTRALLESQGRYLLFMARDFDGSNPAWQETWTKIYLKAREKQVSLLVVSNQPVMTEKWINQSNHFGVPVLSCDGTVMKTMLRAQTGLVAMDGATVAGKWSEADMHDAVKWLNARAEKPQPR
ncbi:MAG: DoxX family protein [Chitinophagaceae bacterium]|nr:DoxX family protein [Chitinophagaceae bacterium]